MDDRRVHRSQGHVWPAQHRNRDPSMRLRAPESPRDEAERDRDSRMGQPQPGRDALYEEFCELSWLPPLCSKVADAMCSDEDEHAALGARRCPE